MPFVARNNIDRTTNDVRSPILNRDPRAMFAVSGGQKRTRVPVHDISPPSGEREAVLLRRRLQPKQNQRGVPLATFVSHLRSLVRNPSAAVKETVRKADEQLEEGVILDRSTITTKEAKVRRARRQSRSLRWSVVALTFALSLVAISLVGSVHWLGKGVLIRVGEIGQGTEAVADLVAGEEALRMADYERAAEAFRSAHVRLERAEDAVGFVGHFVSRLLSLFPGEGRRLSSSERMLAAASALSRTGEQISRALGVVRPSEEVGADALTDRLAIAEDNVSEAARSLEEARKALDGVDPTSLDHALAATFSLLRDRIPPLQGALNRFLDSSDHVLSLLGHNAPVSYLLLFQNSAELRATGGFIGTVALLELDKGEVRRLESANVFDVDGQLLEKVVPPRPIQKISTAWSLHDSNWFFDFPTSARNASWFYEHAGGPTVDGVVAVTPDFLVRLLGLLGPVHLSEYDATLTADNALIRLQQQVEQGYTQSINRPKRIVDDLIPALQQKLGAADTSVRAQVGAMLLESLNDRTIMIWLRDKGHQRWIDQQGWAGSVHATEGDYLAVVHSNINGFKTDAVIENDIRHDVQVQADGRIVDTVAVTRRHTGGSTGVEWWDRVNADYLRVYVPKGSRLLSVEGHTPERVEELFPYEDHGFSRNTDVLAFEQTFRIDEKTGTHIFEEGDKTVFANWVYVSPGRAVTVRYTYELPFRARPSRGYTMTFQRQPGVLEGSFLGTLRVDELFAVAWASQGLSLGTDGVWRVRGSLGEDQSYGLVLEGL